MKYLWNGLGLLLLGWIGFDLYHGFTLLNGVVYRDQEPLLYWISLSLWLGLAISCFYSKPQPRYNPLD